MKRRFKALLAGAVLAAPAMALAAQLVVLDARGGGLKPGQSIDSARPIALKEGERVTVISPDGRSVTLRGAFNGPPMQTAAAAANPRLALAALVSTRNARSSSIGAIRAGSVAAPLPDPWLIDISRPGPRCLREGETPVWWHPESATAKTFTVYPIDRSWRADFAWGGADRMPAPRLSKLDGANLFVIRMDGQDNAISLNVIPKSVDNEMVLTAWMLEKGCIQQADAYLKAFQAKAGPAS